MTGGGDTPSPTPGLYYKTIESNKYAVNELGELAWIRFGGEVKLLQGQPGNMGPVSPGSLSPLMAEPLHEIEGTSVESFTYLNWSFTAQSYTWSISPELQELT